LAVRCAIIHTHGGSVNKKNEARKKRAHKLIENLQDILGPKITAQDLIDALKKGTSPQPPKKEP
jgi:hypothetical protein